MKAIIVCGSRHLDPAKAHHVSPIQQILDEYGPRTVVIHGDARGADLICDIFARMKGMAVLKMPAPWEQKGRAAGMFRNQAMLAVLLQLQLVGYEPACVAFPLRGAENRGTTGMWHAAKLRNVACRVIEVLE